MAAISPKAKKIIVTEPVAKKFILEKVLGEGGFGTVYEGHKIKKNGQISEKTLAIKVHKMHGRTQATVRKEEEESAEIQSTLGPEYKTKVYPIGENGVISVMEKLPGKNLYSSADELQRLTLSQRLELAMLIAQTYAEFHAQRGRVHNNREGLSHTDIKPENILIDIQWINGKPKFQVRIIDFADTRARTVETTAPERFHRQKLMRIDHALEQETYGMASLLAPFLYGIKALNLTPEGKKVINLLEAMSSDNPAIRPSDLAIVKVLNNARIVYAEKEEKKRDIPKKFAAFNLSAGIKSIFGKVFHFFGKKEQSANAKKIEPVSEENLTAFGMAVKLGQYEKAKHLLQKYKTPLEKQAAVRQVDLNGRSLLHLAVLAKRSDLVKLLLDNGADVNQLDTDGRSPLHCAIAMRADVQLIQLLLEEDADIAKQNSYRYTPLESAVVNAGSLEVVKAILEKHTVIPAPRQLDLLQFAVVSGSLELVKHFWIKECSAETLSGLLYSAVDAEHIKVAQFLIKQGADITVQDKEGRTPLHLAVSKGNKELIDILIKNEADINAIDNQQRTPLHLATLAGQTELAISLVLTGAKVAMRDSKGYTPLHLAIAQGNTALVRFFKHHYDKKEFQAIKNELDNESDPLLYSSTVDEKISLPSVPVVAEPNVDSENKTENPGENAAKTTSVFPMFSWFGNPVPVKKQLVSESAKEILAESNNAAEAVEAKSEIKPPRTETENTIQPTIVEPNDLREKKHQDAVKALVSSRFTCLAPGTGVYVLSDTVAPLDLPPAAPTA